MHLRAPINSIYLMFSVLIALCSSGCASERYSLYPDPQTTGTVPAQARWCGTGIAGRGINMMVGMGADAYVPGTYVVLRDNIVILREKVVPKDTICTEIHRYFGGDCHVVVKINGKAVDTITCKTGVYRTYLVPLGA
jgi:hypothetical protein